MGREFVARKSSVWGKKSDTKPSLFTSRPFAVQTRKQNTVNKKELPSEIPPANYITDKIGLNAPQPTVQRQEDNSDKEQEPNLMSKSDESPVADEEETVSPQLEDQNQDQETVSPQLEEQNQEENLDKKSIQTKLTVGEPGDKYEQEADTVAAKVVEHINSPKSQQPVQGKVEPVVQPTLMRQGGAGKGTVNRDVEQNIQQARGGGQGLADNVRQPMEQAFGADFSGVKVHTGGQADVLNRSLNSRAFATGQDIFFKQGEYNPGSKQGQELLAHELTHVVQQKPNTTMQRKKSESTNPAQKLIDKHSSLLGLALDEEALAADLLSQMPANSTFALAVLKKLSSVDRDDVSEYFFEKASDEMIKSIARNSAGARFLALAVAELTDGITFPGERKQADRVVKLAAQAKESQNKSVETQIATPTETVEVFTFIEGDKFLDFLGVLLVGGAKGHTAISVGGQMYSFEGIGWHQNSQSRDDYLKHQQESYHKSPRRGRNGIGHILKVTPNQAKAIKAILEQKNQEWQIYGIEGDICTDATAKVLNSVLKTSLKQLWSPQRFIREIEKSGLIKSVNFYPAKNVSNEEKN